MVFPYFGNYGSVIVRGQYLALSARRPYCLMVAFLGKVGDSNNRMEPYAMTSAASRNGWFSWTHNICQV